MIYVYTSILSGWDNLRPPLIACDPDVRFICFTNVPNLPRVDPWEYRPLYDVGQACRTARVPKILPHLMLPSDAEFSIYHDGNFQLKQRPGAMLAELLATHDWAAHMHPCRSCIYDEAKVLLDEKIGTAELVSAEIARYREFDYPERNGLWANGLLVRRHSPAVIALCERWWALYSIGCERDQLSFPVARHLESVPVRTINAQVYQSPYMNFYWHAAWKDKTSSEEYHSERAGIRERLAKLAQVVGREGGVKYPEY